MLNVWCEVQSRECQDTRALEQDSPAFPHLHSHNVPLLHSDPAAEEQLAVIYRKKTYLHLVTAFILK